MHRGWPDFFNAERGVCLLLRGGRGGGGGKGVVEGLWGNERV